MSREISSMCSAGPISAMKSGSPGEPSSWRGSISSREWSLSSTSAPLLLVVRVAPAHMAQQVSADVTGVDGRDAQEAPGGGHPGHPAEQVGLDGRVRRDIAAVT